MIFSLDESIQKLKAEILSQDWRLPQKKIEPLLSAIICLKNRFNTRKNVLALLTMAESILLYARKRQGQVPPEFIDFLKENMAHVVCIYEDDKFDPDMDAALYKRMYGKFVRLKAKVAAAREGASSTEAYGAGAAGEGLESCPESVSLDEAEEGPDLNRPAGDFSTHSNVQAASTADEPKPLPISAGVLVRPLTIGKQAMAIAEKHIALVRPLSPRKRKKYINSSQVPLKELEGWFCRLSGQMKGPLALLENSRLKKMTLPLMIPKGLGLAELYDEEATWLVAVSNRNWHGVIICRDLAQKSSPLLSRVQEKNGDFVGPGRLGAKQELQLLNIRQLLEREGLLLVLK